MPVPTYGHRRPVCIADDAGVNVARVADDGTGVIRLAVDALITGGGVVITPNGNFDFGAVDETTKVQWVRSALTGYYSAAAVGSRNVPIEARKFTANVDVTGTLVGVHTNSRNSIYKNNASDWSVWSGDSPSDVSGADATTPIAAYVNAMGVGIDNSGAPVKLRAIEGRAPGIATLDERLYGLYTLAHLRALNPGAAAGSKSVALNAGAASAAQDETLMRLLCRCAMAGLDYSAGAGSQSVALVARNVGVTPVDERYPGNYSLAFVRGINSAAAAGSQGVAVEAFTGAVGVIADKTKYGLVANARTAGYGIGGADWFGIYADTVASVSGRAASTPMSLYVNATAVGVDNTGAAVLRPVEARVASTISTGFAGALIGLTTNSRLAAYMQGEWRGITGAYENSVSVADAERAYAIHVLQPRESGFSVAQRGKRFIMTGQTPGTLITGGTAFVATAPALMLRINSANYRAIIRSLTISIGNTPGGPVYIAVALDTADRYTSGGGAVTPVNTNEESATATGVLAYDNSVAIVAAAAGATTRYIVNDIISATPGTIYECSFADEILMGPTASTLLVYVWAATTAPQFTYGIDLEDVT